MTYKNLQELFADPKRWTKGALARDNSGENVEPIEPLAVCWCLEGGVRLVYQDEERQKIREKISERIGFLLASQWNDSPKRTIEDVQNLCKELNI